jgi:hypothetical protein
MALPLKTTSDDVRAVAKYLRTKPAGASMADAKAVNAKMVDSRKLAAYGAWGIVEREDGKLKLTERGSRLARNPDDETVVFREILNEVKPYRSALEWAYHQSLSSIDTNDVSGHFHQHHSDVVGAATETTLRDNALSFFHVVDAGGLGTVTVGRRGSATRVELSQDALKRFVESEPDPPSKEEDPALELPDFARQKPEDPPPAADPAPPSDPPSDLATNRQVFITHGKNQKIVEQLKELLTYGKFEPVVSVERESVSQPVPAKVLGDMRLCAAAVIHVGAEQRLRDGNDKEVVVLNPNVLIEIGAAMMQYGRNFILLVEEGTTLPSNLQGLYEVRYSGDGLDHDSTMKLLKAFNDFDV